MGDAFGYWIHNGVFQLVDIDNASLEQEHSWDFHTFLALLFLPEHPKIEQSILKMSDKVIICAEILSLKNANCFPGWDNLLSIIILKSK
ncbi:hypothetical protein [Thermoactinomyces mirandus]|uniref:hypothetical protein n=1 Tax=Thermoactinomyces mirandus TaxID=2756294 RepID=UPI001C691462|nr:hypothetical protein [Thermoactinomyces mirandus]